MHETIMKKNYAKAFRNVILLAVVLGILSAIVIPVSLSRQISDILTLKQTQQEQPVQDGGREEHGDREEQWRSRITPPFGCELCRSRRNGSPLACAVCLLLAAGSGLALQKRGKRGNEQIPLANSGTVYQSAGGLCLPHCPG